MPISERIRLLACTHHPAKYIRFIRIAFTSLYFFERSFNHRTCEMSNAVDLYTLTRFT